MSLLAFAMTDRMVLAEEQKSLLECQGKDYATLSDNGLLEKGDAAAVAQRARFTVDLSTGLLAYANEQGREWVVLQKGNDHADWVLAKPNLGQAYANNFIRIRAWQGETTIPFLMVSISSIISGTCSAVQ